MGDFPLLDEAQRLYAEGDFDGAISIYNRIASATADRSLISFLDLNVAQCLRRLGRVEEALALIERAQDQIGDQHSQLRAQLALTAGNLLGDQKRHLQAIGSLVDAEKEFRLQDSKTGIWQCGIGVARSLAAIGAAGSASQVLTQLLETPGLDDSIRSQALNNYALLERDMNQPDRALDLLRQNLSLSSTLEDDYDRAVTLLNLTAVLIDVGEVIEARIVYGSARSLTDTLRVPELSSRSRDLHEQLYEEGTYPP